MAWSLQGAEKMAKMRVAKANGESISKQYLEAKTPTSPIVVEIKEAMQKELKRLKQTKLLGRGNHSNIPLFSSGSNLTRMVLKALNKKNAVLRYVLYVRFKKIYSVLTRSADPSWLTYS
jgi:predicted DNA binding protein